MNRRRFPDVVLRTQDGLRVRFYQDLVRDRRVVIAFMYTHCTGSCPATTAKMAALQHVFGEHMGRDIRFLSITLDARRDDPPALKAYARESGAGAGWLFLTGDVREIDQVRRSLGVRDPDPAIDADRTQHAAILTFGNDRTGRWAALPAPMSTPFLASAISRIVGLPQP